MCATCSTSVFTGIISIVFKFAIIFIISVFMFKVVLSNAANFYLLMRFVCLFVNGIVFFFSKLLAFIAYSSSDSQKCFMQFSILYASWLLSVPTNSHIVEIEYPHEKCSPTLIADFFSEQFLHLSIFFNKRLKICINNGLCLIRFPILIKL